jgi:hypothetical protein
VCRGVELITWRVSHDSIVLYSCHHYPSKRMQLCNIFTVPDLVATVCKFLEPSDCAQVARVGRVAHYGALPLVWEHVKGVHNLLRLLPGVKVSEYEPSKFNLVSLLYWFFLRDFRGAQLTVFIECTKPEYFRYDPFQDARAACQETRNIRQDG